MVVLNDVPNHPDIKYPCNWNYKIITEDEEAMKKEVEELTKDRVSKLSKSKDSSKGKYKSFNLEVLVHNDDDRMTIFEELKKMKPVKMVL
ncbi:MAG: DUF493 domain-containing protein [Epsilonproteobacteria bacterium]|nr:DUF493 domain-containing protein [Campylobacterota bacterium]